ncbi:MAG: CBS domain containing-hemolysin-like protein [Pseudohongiellaceae bacterium]|jgi:CBS domain containing-hemolysin-like protein
MKHIKIHALSNLQVLSCPSKIINLDQRSPALEVFTDFFKRVPLIIEADCNAEDAEHLMKKAHVKMKLVVDGKGNFVGLVSLEDINSQEIIKQISNGLNRKEILVEDLMKPKKNLGALDYRDIRNASISDVMKTLEKMNQQHCLVVDKSMDEIRGLFSASDIARCLSIPLSTYEKITFKSLNREANNLRNTEFVL